jgi:two-component system response regulator QseB
MRLLLIEDDPMIGQSICQGLHHDGFVVDWVQDGEPGERALASAPYALLVLDLGLPGKSGLDVLRELRAGGNDLPVLIVTAHDAVEDRVEGLNAGADDYLVKPFALAELTARIRALLRRRAGHAEPTLTRGALTLDAVRSEVTIRGGTVTLLEEKLYGWQEEVESNAVAVHIHNLRKKLGESVIRNIRGLGYTLAERP